MTISPYYVLATKKRSCHVKGMGHLLVRRDRLILDTPKARNILKQMRPSLLRKTDLWSLK